MEQYKLIFDPFAQGTNSVQRLSDMASIPFDPANTDYQKFKIDVADGVPLEDVDGNVMTHEAAVSFIESLP